MAESQQVFLVRSPRRQSLSAAVWKGCVQCGDLPGGLTQTLPSGVWTAPAAAVPRSGPFQGDKSADFPPASSKFQEFLSRVPIQPPVPL